MGRLLDRLQPRAILIVETEIWPNLIRVAGQRGIPMILVNGRISPRAFPRYRIVARFFRHVLHDVRLFAMQTEEDAARIRSLGAPKDRIRVTGNLKFDLPVPIAAGADVRQRIGLADRDIVFVAGSTAPGEESPVLQAFSALRQAVPSARLVMAPRHLKDLARAETALSAWPYRAVTWSQVTLADRDQAPSVEGYDVLLVDVMGVLPEIYAAADLVFVGGSLVARGGHNILEPAALGKPVLFGPHMENFSAAAETLTEAGAAFVARDGQELGQLAIRLVSDRAAYEVASTMARRVIQAHSGAMAVTLRLIDETLSLGAADSGAVTAS
jgi:3-deoxy-D-manno-octulosonic-acid transferase